MLIPSSICSNVCHTQAIVGCCSCLALRILTSHLRLPQVASVSIKLSLWQTLRLLWAIVIKTITKKQLQACNVALNEIGIWQLVNNTLATPKQDLCLQQKTKKRQVATSSQQQTPLIFPTPWGITRHQLLVAANVASKCLNIIAWNAWKFAVTHRFTSACPSKYNENGAATDMRQQQHGDNFVCKSSAARRGAHINSLPRTI